MQVQGHNTGSTLDFVPQALSTTDAANVAAVFGGGNGGARVQDIDGDGLPDMFAVSPTNTYVTDFSTRDRAGITHPFSTPASSFCISPFYGMFVPSILDRWADMDGDGLADSIVIEGTDVGSPGTIQAAVLPNRGDGRFGVGAGRGNCWDGYGNYAFSTVSPTTSTPIQQTDFLQFADFNGDGFDDYALLNSQGLTVCLRHGATWDTASWQCATDATLKITQQVPPSGGPLAASRQSIQVGDLDASGINQVVFLPVAAAEPTVPIAISVSPTGSGTRDGLLQTISNGVGASTTIEYGTVYNLLIQPQSLTNVGMPVPAWVVTETFTDNGLAAGVGALAVEKHYDDAGPIYDPRDRAFVGFRSVTESVVPIGSSARANPTTTTFATIAGSPGAGGQLRRSRVSTRGLPLLAEASSYDVAPTVGNPPSGKKFTTLRDE